VVPGPTCLSLRRWPLWAPHWCPTAIAGLSFVGSAVFSSVVGQVRYAKAAGQLQIDQNGDGVGDFFLQLDPGTVLVAGDLVL
jgi:hypothetical protein